MKVLLSILFTVMIHSYGSGQRLCSGPLDVTVSGSASGTPLLVDHFSYDVFCLGLDEGAIELLIDGGSPGYSFEWNTGSNAQELVNISAGTYSVTITDGKSCADTLSIEIEDIHPLVNDMNLLEDDGCGVCSLTDSVASYFYSDIDYMLYIEDVMDGFDLGEIQTCVETVEETMFIENNPALHRSWCVDSDNGGAATIRLFFTDEEFQELMADSDVPFIRSANLIVKGYSGGAGTPEDYDIELTAGDISLALFDNIDNVWSVEFTIDNLPANNTCFYLLYIRDESQKELDELTRHIEEAEFVIIENPVVDRVRLKVDHLGCVLSGNVYIEDEIQQLVYRSTFVDTYLDVLSYDVSQYAAGMYFLTIEFPNANISKTFKFIKITP